MPLVQIDIDRARFEAQRDAISDAIHRAQVDVLRIPEDDKFQIFRPYEPGERRLRFNSDYDDRPDQLIVHLTMVRQYSVATKFALYKQILLNLGALGIHPGDVHIPVMENGFEDWFAGALD